MTDDFTFDLWYAAFKIADEASSGNRRDDMTWDEVYELASEITAGMDILRPLLFETRDAFLKVLSQPASKELHDEAVEVYNRFARTLVRPVGALPGKAEQ